MIKIKKTIKKFFLDESGSIEKRKILFIGPLLLFSAIKPALAMQSGRDYIQVEHGPSNTCYDSSRHANCQVPFPKDRMAIPDSYKAVDKDLDNFYVECSVADHAHGKGGHASDHVNREDQALGGEATFHSNNLSLSSKGTSIVATHNHDMMDSNVADGYYCHMNDHCSDKGDHISNGVSGNIPDGSLKCVSGNKLEDGKSYSFWKKP